MRLVPYTNADLPLTAALESDPAVMGQLGGPVSAEGIAETHAHRLAGMAGGDRYYRIVADTGEDAGIVGLWATQWAGSTIHEAGLMLLPPFQGKGMAYRGMAALFDVTRDEGRVSEIHVFPAVTNAASNAVARQLGFTPLGEHDLDYSGRPLRCRHWVIRLT
ncbi:GNAT family N-acetyltransferase [Virgisporangium aliadipatigenens]|uniref:GNAT family N-acetyltransferase n=1 Tax=Virgisporangium aliadipatigenens TaxID=741659 RepID=UPI001943CC09|nr:GNAT family N-acetyltransferase [Virgisporangium aliadipatigenens]